MAKTKFETLICQDLAGESNPTSTMSNHINETDKISNSLSHNNSLVKSSLKFLKKRSHSFDKKASQTADAQESMILHQSSQSLIKLNKSMDVLNLNKIELVKDDEDMAELATSEEPHLFIENAIKELLNARRILRCSYVYGYYLDQFGHKKFIFEYIQTEFEESTENLSQIIARPHLKTSKRKIVRLTNILKRKRIEFLDTITRGLNSFNDTPPTLKKYSRQRWKYLLKDNIQHDDEFKNTVAISLKELNPKNPWIIDKKGRHTNLLALLNDWPELEEELDSILVPAKEKNGLCSRWDCGQFLYS